MSYLQTKEAYIIVSYISSTFNKKTGLNDGGDDNALTE